MHARTLLVAGLMVGSLALSARADFARPDLEKIPVDRLAQNLSEMAQKNPKDAQILYNLARLHAMAFATKAEEFDVWKGRLKNGAWFGFTPAIMPFAPKQARDDKTLKAALEHLDKAIEVYGQALKVQPDHLHAQLGLAWSRDKKGDKKEAIEGYRKVVEKGWAIDKERKSGVLGGRFVTVEAGNYLIPLLDARADQDEIQTLKQRMAQLARLPRLVTPLVIPLHAGLGVRDLEDRQARVAFDADGSGLQRTWSWITPQAGWLVYAPSGKAKVSSALQMFGTVSFWLFWEHGYQALQSLDDNGDGQIAGAELRDLAIWCDLNGNGVCDPGEVQPLSAFGITALSCRCQRDTTHPDRIWYSPHGVTFADGSTRPTFDVILHEVVQPQPVDVPPEIQVPKGHKLVARMQAKGVQVYKAVPGKNRGLEWMFEGPLAELTDGMGTKLGIHYNGPAWEAADGSKVIKDDGKKGETVDAVNRQTDLPWLLVPVKADDLPDAKPGTFSRVVYVQRVATAGGQAPAALPKRAGSRMAVPYTAMYYFWARID